MVGAIGIYALALNVLAVPVPHTLNHSEGLIVSFDFSKANFSPALPYAYISGEMYFKGWDAGDQMVMDRFNHLDGNGYAFTVEGVGAPSFSWGVGGNDPIDGQFSFGFRMISGSAEFLGGYATGDDGFGVPLTQRLEGRISNVPEPTTLALLALGVAGIRVMCRKQ